MSSTDLVFHIVSKRKWHQLNRDGFYRPEQFDEQVGIECVDATSLKPYLDKHFAGRRNLLLLVIDLSRVINARHLDAETGYIYIDRGINLDAILDKIKIGPTEDGTFDIEVSG